MSWCPDCVTAEPVVAAALDGVDDDLVLIHCAVGQRTFWKDQANVFRLTLLREAYFAFRCSRLNKTFIGTNSLLLPPLTHPSLLTVDSSPSSLPISRLAHPLIYPFPLCQTTGPTRN